MLISLVAAKSRVVLPVICLGLGSWLIGCDSKHTELAVSDVAVTAVPAPPADLGFEEQPSLPPGVAFIDDYLSNTTDNLTADSNAVIRILSGMYQLWQTGPDWHNGVPLDADTTRRNIQYVVQTTLKRTPEQTARAFIYDRQHQSHGVIGGLGPLAELYREGALAVSGIQSMPVAIPADKVNEILPASAPAGAALGAGSRQSVLGKVAELVETVRGSHSSSNPSKYAFQYPRPWRMTDDNQVIDTGRRDDMGYPVYVANTFVIPQLLRQRGETPEKDGGFPSGHTNAAYLAALTLAYAIPERFQQMVVRATELGHSRIEAGMHSPLDVMGGRIMSAAILTAVLNDPAYRELKQAARQQALAYFSHRLETDAAGVLHYADSQPLTDPYADYRRNRQFVTPKLTYILQRDTAVNTPMLVPAGAEALLETRFPYLSASQRRAVLRSTALPAGYPLLDGPEQWGRLNLFAAADGYGEFNGDVKVMMDAGQGGFHAQDRWRNDIGGAGKLLKLGSGQLMLAGDNRYAGGTELREGWLVAASLNALGTGDVYLAGGGLRIAAELYSLWLHGDYTQLNGTELAVTITESAQPKLQVSGKVTLAGAVLEVDAPAEIADGSVFTLLRSSGGIAGQFADVRSSHYRITPIYSEDAVQLRFNTK
ncbi:phosphatase PAP2 family protein [Chromatiaceae bacterium AAb-1]|nr:phosphatase PAP2 family protein [Chromatiaceae bacterium AAb-1]